MEMAQLKTTDRRRMSRAASATPKSAAELRKWVIDRFGMDEARTSELLADWTSWAGGKEQGHNKFNLKRSSGAPVVAPASGTAPAPVSHQKHH